MLAAIRIAGAVCLFAALVPAQFAQIALVNDPMSHGTLGDSKLSLEEAIQVMNTQLTVFQLSAAERAQIRGIPPALDTIEIDFTITPVITIERQLSDIEGDTITHVDCHFNGLNGRPVIEGGSVPVVFPLRTNHAMLRNLIVRDGGKGITWSSDLHYHPGVRFLVDNCLFTGQTQVGIECQIIPFPPGDIEPGDIFDTVIDGAPIGLRFLDAGVFGDMNMTFRNNVIQNCQTGIHADMNGSGSTVALQFNDTKILGAQDGVVVRRPSLADSTLDLQFVGGEVVASRHGFDIGGEAIGIGPTVLSLHHFQVQGGPGATDYAFRTSPETGLFDLVSGENEFVGNVDFAMGTRSTSLRVHNSTFDGGTVSVNTTGATPDLLWNLFENAPVDVASRNTKAVAFQQCDFISSPITDKTASGVTTLTGCHLTASPMTGTIVNISPAPARWIGRANVAPEDPQIGTFVDLSVDLPSQMAAVWLLGIPVQNPVTVLTPFRFYFHLAPVITLPGAVTGQQNLRIPIPNNAALRGAALYAQPFVAPIGGQTYVPAFTMPQGGIFSIQ